MSAADIAGVVTVVVLVLATALLSMAETVLLRLNLVRALRLDEEDAPGAGKLLWLLEHRGRSLNVVLLLTVASRVTAAGVATAVTVRHVPGAGGVAVAIVAVLVLSLLGSEIAPRTLALRHLEETGLRLAPLMVLLIRAFDPVSHLFVVAGRRLARSHAEVSGPYPSDDELREILAADDDDEELEEDERAMIHSIFELGDTVAREIMVPRPDMVSVAESADLRELVNTIIEHGFSRIPIYRDERDDIVGVVYAKDVLQRLALQPGREEWTDLVRPPTFVPETKRIDDLLRSLQEQAVHLAIVVDEYGAMIGLVTIEDILEEIVGEIIDEHDREEPLVELLEDERIRVDARLSVGDLNELLDADLPEDGWDTVGGLVFGILGRVPTEGDAVDIDGLTLVTERVQGRRVSKVLVTRRDDEEQHDEAERIP